MNRAPLTAAYRPQRFSELAGQATLKGILSRAAAEDRIATAYLFSGTRGVGKTTVARILAKAVNCVNAPTAEPCNECNHCRQITQGSAVDVIEIDAASNRGIDDARRIREDIGYAPMECRYKVFIIDEAHMLTVHAANALLKTLEEPPKNVTFILATTEPHKILPTIISRCQHYSFKRLTQPELVAHLEKVLTAEKAAYDPRALQFLAKRAAGSVRDSMSLLGQALALGGERLEVEAVRQVLGLAGQEIFFQVLEAIHAQDPLAINTQLRELLDQGLDLGFFLRELTQVWRNLFLLKQVGDKAAPMLELTEEEVGEWLKWAQAFTLPHIHACWQLTIEGQRRVLTSLEPAMALELLLLNLAFLPSLINLERVPQGGSGPASPPPGRGGAPGPAMRGGGQAAGPASGGTPPNRQGMAGQETPSSSQNFQAPHPPPGGQPARAPSPCEAAPEPPPASQNCQPCSNDVPWDDSPPVGEPAPAIAPAREARPRPSGPLSWTGFLEYAKQAGQRDQQPVKRLLQASGEYMKGRLFLPCKSEVQRRMLLEGAFGGWVRRVACEYFGEDVELQSSAPKLNLINGDDCKQALQEHPVVQTLQQELGARIIDWRPIAQA